VCPSDAPAGHVGATIDPDSCEGKTVGLFTHGMVKFDNAGTASGEAVSGTFSADLLAPL
jgi:hypothetical protein